MNRLHLSLAVLALAGGAAFACGGISDPRRGSENTSTVSGALTAASVPSGAHVALVWRLGTGRAYEVGSDAPIVDGRFTMALPTPADAYFFTPSADGNEVNDPAPDTDTPPQVGEGDSQGEDGNEQLPKFQQKLAPRDQASGGITSPLSAAVAGFVVYVDANGNGKLDLEGNHAGSPDQILGGNAELLLTYFKGGGTLDYEKLRDTSGVAPAPGYNLIWGKGRFVPLNLVELKLASSTRLPPAVCPVGSSSGDELVPDTTEPSPGPFMYPTPGDPRLHCAEDGRSYTYDAEPPAPCSPGAPTGLCSSSGEGSPFCAGSRPPMQQSIAEGEPVPQGWPCQPMASALDAGPCNPCGGALDGGALDGGGG